MLWEKMVLYNSRLQANIICVIYHNHPVFLSWETFSNKVSRWKMCLSKPVFFLHFSSPVQTPMMSFILTWMIFAVGYSTTLHGRELGVRWMVSVQTAGLWWLGLTLFVFFWPYFLTCVHKFDDTILKFMWKDRLLKVPDQLTQIV